MATDGLDAARWSGRLLRFATGVGIIGPSFEILLIEAVGVPFGGASTAAISSDFAMNKHTLPPHSGGGREGLKAFSRSKSRSNPFFIIDSIELI